MISLSIFARTGGAPFDGAGNMTNPGYIVTARVAIYWVNCCFQCSPVWEWLVYAKAMSNTQPSPFTFTSQRLTLSGVTWGSKEKPLIILVHGGLDQKRSWDWTARVLADDHFVVAYDLRGHGQSDWVSDGDYGVMDHVYDLAALVDELDIEISALVGHSLGGNIALRYTGLFPDRVKKLVAIEGLGPSPKMLAERNAKSFDDRLRSWIEDRQKKSARVPRALKSFEEALSRMTTAHTHLDAEQLEHLTRTGIHENEDGTFRWAYDPAAMGRSPSDIPYHDFVGLLEKITCPTWLVYGAKSWASNPQKDGRMAYLKNAQLSEYKDAGHWLHHDSFDLFIDELKVFLEG